MVNRNAFGLSPHPFNHHSDSDIVGRTRRDDIVLEEPALTIKIKRKINAKLWNGT
jgi:hypothetical protein